MTDSTDRRGYLGGTDMAAVLGVSPYRAPIEVWNEKRGGPGQPQSLRMRLGQLLEGAVADIYSETTGRRLRRAGTVVHPDYPYLVAHPDRLVVGERGVVEVKTSSSSRGYEDGVPPHVHVQAVWYCGLTRREWCDVVLLAHMDIKVVRIEADPALYEDMVRAGVDWWATYIEGGTEPEPDGSEAYRRHLSTKYPLDSGVERVATPEQTLLGEELRIAKAEEKDAKARGEVVANRLRAAMAGATALIGPGWRVTWTTQPGRTDWKGTAADFRRLLEANAEAIELPESDYDLEAWLGFIAVQHTGEPSRVFRSYFNDTEESNT